ncbi:hypothetical protein ADL27_40780 [Streptomyces sp. NRRL F-6602]|nr:hypothetical protein ADL27_40780 [Streptomyces sp. NRRL F-6602]
MSPAHVAVKGQAALAAKHRTELTLNGFIGRMGRIAMRAALYGDEADEIARRLRKLIKEIRAMKEELAVDDNVTDRQFQRLMDDLVEQAGAMQTAAQRMTAACRRAADGSLMAVRVVDADYHRDMKAKQDAGLAHVSAASHHEGD